MFFAIGMELTGTTLLKYSQGFTKLLPTIGCFFSFSRALNDLNLGLAYATWSGVGIVASVLISWFLFGEKLNGWGIFAVAMIIIGCIILNVFGTDH